MYLNYNGKIFESTAGIINAQSRGLRYGDGLFETLKLMNGSIVMADEHFARLWKGMQLLHFEIPKLFSPEKLQEEIISLSKKNKVKRARIRLTVIRGEGGLYDPKNHLPNYIIEATALSPGTGQLNSNGLQLCLYTDAVKSIDRFSNIKHNNYLPYFMGAIAAKQRQCNDAVILNSKGNVCDSTIANIFIVKNSECFTPSLQEGCVAGIMRKWLTEKIRELEFTVHETAITSGMLLAADEIFLSNSIYNIRTVAAYEDKKYSSNFVLQLAEKLQMKYPDILC